MKALAISIGLVLASGLGVAAQSTTTCTRYSSQTGCPAVYDPCCAFNCIAAGGMFSSCLDFDDTRPQVICSACPSTGLETAVPTSTSTSTPTYVQTKTSTNAASTCTPYFLMTGCPEVYDPCCAFSCVSAGGMGSTCLDYDDTQPQVVCKACPSDLSSTTTAKTTPATETTEPATSTTSAPASTCTPYFLMTGCPKVYDPCCAFNCIAAGGRGSTCLDYDDTRPQVVCKACPSDVSTSHYGTLSTAASPAISTTSSSAAGVSSSSSSRIESGYQSIGISSSSGSGNVSTSTPSLPTPTKDHDSSAVAGIVSFSVALGLGLLCTILIL
ncbi:hypothetical protein TWF481_001880 [Arthrobotrys musiformis]|uniref:Uncharacterized protein n=1 Tax=Arthrobotrys musiformis TaxID=47236 RepID=A0AAV9VUL4_9PEZI